MTKAGFETEVHLKLAELNPNRSRVFVAIAALYVTQFIPLIFVMTALPVILRQEGHSAAAIGIVQLATLPYVLKFFWAPLIDRYEPMRNRGYSGWIIFLSVAHVLALVGLAFMNPAGPLFSLGLVLLVAILAVSTQDVAVDALTIRLLRPNERAVGSALQTTGGYVGALLGAGLFLYIYEDAGWRAAMLIQAGVFAVPLLALTFVIEPGFGAQTSGQVWRLAISFFRQRGIGGWIAILCTIRLPVMLMLLPLQVALVDGGMSASEIGFWMGAVSMSAASLVALAAGPFMKRFKRLTALRLAASTIFALVFVVNVIANFDLSLVNSASF